MAKINLTTRLNLKIVGVVLLLMIVVSAYNYWLLRNEEDCKNIKLMTAVTDFLVKQKPAGSFSDMAVRQGAAGRGGPEQVLAINKELQPIMNKVLVPNDKIKFGFYSRQQESIVAIGPHYDASLLIGVEPGRYESFYEANTDQILERQNSFVWHGARVISHIRPITENGVVIGHAFAILNQDAVYASIWRRTVNAFLGAFLMLLVCVAIFRELFIKLKTDLQLFAEQIADGHTANFTSEIAELTPILKYISEQTEKMTQLERLNIIGEMAAGIAHEIRNPMTTVRGLLQFLGNKPDFAGHRKDFELMIEEIDRANSIITEFLSLAKNRAMEFSEHNLNDIIRDIFPLLRADALRNDCKIEVKLTDIPGVSVDPGSIRQLILNMVRNGLDAMPGGGTITVGTAAAGDKVRLSIKDCGSGISPAIRDKLGTPFFTTKEKGTGLGLAICYRIIQRHGATVTVDSEPGMGTEFTITFPPLPTEAN